MWWDRFLDPFRGKAVTIPPLDGALTPNRALDEADLVFRSAAAEDLAAVGGDVLVADGAAVWRVGGGVIARFPAPVAALAAQADGGFAAALADGSVEIRGGRFDGRRIAPPAGAPPFGPTAMAALGDGELVLCRGAADRPPADWQIDLMDRGAGGSVVRLDLETGAETVLAAGLGWPAGVLVEADRSIVVAEAWRHRLVRISPDGRGRVSPVLEDLPGYPGRMTRAADGGAWLALFAPRNRLVELVLQEDGFRRAMMAEVPRAAWIAPALSSGATFLEPLQNGGVIVMGIRKPWAPTRSYGLAVRLDAAHRPVRSLHSRADGGRHGVTAVVETGGTVHVLARGGGAVLRTEAGR